MKNDSKSALKIKQFITIFSIFILLGTSMQVFGNNQIIQMSIAKQKQETEKNNIMVNIQEEVLPNVQVADNYKRQIETTSRYAQERTKTQNPTQEEQTILEEMIEEPQVTYIPIEEISISKNMDLTVRCGISKEDFKKLMKNLKVDKSGFFYKNSGIIYDLCEKYELNEIFFCGLIAAESGWNIASSHKNAHNYISMMSKGKLIKYSSDEQGLEAAAKLLHNKYLTKGGSCYYGKTLASVQKRFCPNSSTWVNLVYGCMKQVVK